MVKSIIAHKFTFGCIKLFSALVISDVCCADVQINLSYLKYEEKLNNNTHFM